MQNLPFILSNQRNWFPPVDQADADGLLAMGGDLETDRLILAYKSGIFPWYDGNVPLWWSPDPRFVLFPENLKVSKSMQKMMTGNTFKFTTNKAFSSVINHCKTIERKGMEGTWINQVTVRSFTQLHEMGIAQSAEAWQNDKLAGGLYGLHMGNIFFGESMFSQVSNASKFAFIHYVKQLQQEGVYLIDCQVYSAHLESLGAVFIPRKMFIQLLNENIP